MERNCDKCIHHTSGMCDSWDCKIQTVEDVKKEAREKAIEEFAEKLKEKVSSHYVDCDGYFGGIEEEILYAEYIDEIAKEMKGE